MQIANEYKAQQTAVCSLLGGIVADYFRDADHRAAFESWYLERYGKPYQWKKLEV